MRIPIKGFGETSIVVEQYDNRPAYLNVYTGEGVIAIRLSQPMIDALMQQLVLIRPSAESRFPVVKES